MHYVALTRWGAPLEAELPTLSTWLGLAPYDCRMRAAGGLPVVLCVEAQADRAQTRVSELRARGHGAVCCDAASVPNASQHFYPRQIELTADALHCVDGPGNAIDVPYTDVLALVRASNITTAENTVTTVEKKLAVGRALMSGGLMIHKKTEKVTRSATEDREQVLYVFRRSRFEPLVMRELGLRYQGLGAALKPTTAQNFMLLVEQLRARAPQALFDQSFMTQKRKPGISAVTGVANERRVETSNSDGNDLGAFLLVLAHIEKQL
jgi:hypothetical protein